MIEVFESFLPSFFSKKLAGFQGRALNRRPQTAKVRYGVWVSVVEPQPPSADGGILFTLFCGLGRSPMLKSMAKNFKALYSRPIFFIKTAVLYRLGDMLGADGVARIKISNSTRHA